jgi:hypothetical protein
MSEYLNKQAVLEWLKKQRKEMESECEIDREGAYLDVIEEIKSGAFDVDQTEVQRLRAALEMAQSELRWGDPANAIERVERIIDEALSTTTEPTGPYTIRRDEYGHAVAIERNGYTVLHLQPGTERNEQEVEGIVALLNMNAAKVERVREYYRKLEELRNRTKYRDAAIEYEQRMTDICNVLDFLSITIPGINAPEKEGQTE